MRSGSPASAVAASTLDRRFAGLWPTCYARAHPAEEGPRLRLAAGIVTLAHEPQHSKGIADEAVAECLAIQLAPRAAMKLGVSRPYAAMLMRTYWSHYDQEPTAYRSRACRKGGALDLANADSIWP